MFAARRTLSLLRAPPAGGGCACAALRRYSAHAPAMVEYLATSGTTDAFYHVNLSDIVRQHQRWVDELPRVTPHYAVKCNPDMHVLRTLADLGCGFDCASVTEMDALLDLDVAPDRIVYANPCKAPSELEQAHARGVGLTVFDSVEELRKLATVMPEAQLLLRIRPDDSRSICQFGMKYGAALDEVPELLRTAAELSLTVSGVCFHVGSGCYAAEAYSDAVALSRAAFDMGADQGFAFNMLDIGGGMPGELFALETPAVNGASPPAEDKVEAKAPPSFEAIAKVSREALDRDFPAGSGVALIAEPGRYFVHASHTLATQVIGLKADTYSEQGGTSYYINDGVYGSFNCLLYDHAEVTPHVLQRAAADSTAENATPETCSIWGPTCDGLDCVKQSASLPSLAVGDWLYWPGMGAYTGAASSSFNGFAPPRAQYYYDGKPLASMVLEDLEEAGVVGVPLGVGGGPGLVLPTLEEQEHKQAAAQLV